VLEHWPEPDVTFSLTYLAFVSVAVAAVGAKRENAPPTCVGVEARPLAPLQVFPAARLAAGTGKVLAGAGGVPGAVHPLPGPEPRMSKQGLLLLRFNVLGVELVVSVAS